VTNAADAAGPMSVPPPKSTYPTPPVFPPGRYGRRREPNTRRQWLTAVAVILVVAAGAAVAVKLYRQYGGPQFTATVTGLTRDSDTLVTVRFQVHNPGRGAAVCTVNALTYDGSVLGSGQAPVPAGTDVTVSYRLSTKSRPDLVDVPSCRDA
jgi:Domain of unknown function (DUF4307)